MRWPLLLLGAGLIAAIPTAQACTEAAPIPLEDFAYVSWENNTITTVWNGREIHWQLASDEWEQGAEVFEPGHCQPEPGRRASVADPAGQWTLSYDDEWRCCSAWYYGALQLRNGGLHHEWSRSADWIEFEDGVAIRDGGVDWVAFGPPDVRSYGAPLGEWGRLDEDTAYFVYGNVTLLDVSDGRQEHHALPPAMHGAGRALPAPDGGIVVASGLRAVWFNGSFSEPVQASGQVHVVHGGILVDRDHELRMVDPAGSEAHYSGVSVENVGHGPAASAAGLRSNGTAQLWIIDGLQILQRVDMPGSATPHPITPADPASEDGNATGHAIPASGWAAAILLAAARRP